ncbi:DUF2461 domain-containing protein [Halocola ammonii]
MAYFSKKFNQFFIDLAPNNHKEWFDENRKTYEKEVKEPFKKFVGDLIERLKEYDPALNVEPKDSIFRINRDIRFAKDKTPYKMHLAAAISRKGKKVHDYPGLYIHFGPEKVWIGGGAYSLSKEKLEDVRREIAAKPKEFLKAINDKDFVETYGEIQGEAHKRIPKEFKEVAEEVPLIANKQFYYMAEYPTKTLERDDLLEFVVDHYRKALPVHQFLAKALK